MYILIAFAIFCSLQILDIYTTYTVIKSGKGHEANTLMAKLFEKVGLLPGLIGSKSFVTALVFYAFIYQPGPEIVIWILDLAYAAVLFNNFRVKSKIDVS